MDSLFDKFNDDEEQVKFGSDMRNYELYVIIPYIVPILFWLPFAIDKNSDFCKFHSNQSLCWVILFSILEAISGILLMLDPPFNFVGTLLNLFTIALIAFLVIGAWKGYALKIPVIGNLLKPFK